MRTTPTIEEDVAGIERIRRQGRGSLKQSINEALREGLASLESPTWGQAPYETPSHSLGRCFPGSLDNNSDALAAAEGEGYRRFWFTPACSSTPALRPLLSAKRLGTGWPAGLTQRRSWACHGPACRGSRA